MFVRPTAGISTPLGERTNEVQLEFIQHCFTIYKDFIRPFLPESKVYHHTPEVSGFAPKGWGILETTSKNGSKGILGVFQLSNPKERETVVRLRGVDISKNYLVTFDNMRKSCEMSGVVLVNEGIRIRLEGALTSELILFSAM